MMYKYEMNVRENIAGNLNEMFLIILEGERR